MSDRLNKPAETNSSRAGAKSGTAVRSIEWLVVMVQSITLSELFLLCRLLCKPVTQPFLISLLKIRYFFLKSIVKARMCLVKARIICLQRGYLPPYEGNLTPKFIYWCVACLDHPVEIINVFKESFNIMMRDTMPNYKAHLPPGEKEKGQK